MTCAFHPEASLELAEAADWYEDQSFGLGGRFLAAMALAVAAIRSDPELFPPLDGTTRIYRAKVYPYKIFYTYDQPTEAVYLYAVSHNRRRPEYWRGREK